MYFYHIFIFLAFFAIHTDLKAVSFNSHNPSENPKGKDFYKNPEFVKQYYKLKQKKQNRKSNNEDYMKYSTPVELYIEYGAKPVDTNDSGWGDIDYILCNDSNTANINVDSKTKNSTIKIEKTKTKEIEKTKTKEIEKTKSNDIFNKRDANNDSKKIKNSCFLRYKEYKDIGKCLSSNLYNHNTKRIKLKKIIIEKHIKKHNTPKQQLTEQKTPSIKNKKKSEQKSINKISTKTTENKTRINNINYINTSNKIENNRSDHILNESCFLNYKSFKKIGKCITYKIYYPEIKMYYSERNSTTLEKAEKKIIKIKKQDNLNKYSKNHHADKRIKLKADD